MDQFSFNPALNLNAFPAPAAAATPGSPPPLNALYLRDGKFDGMTREDVAASFRAYVSNRASIPRLALFFHGGLVDKASGSKAGAIQYERYKAVAYPYFFIWESGIWEVLAHHLPLIFAETIFGAVVNRTIDALQRTLGDRPTLASVPAPGSSPATSISVDVFVAAAQSNPKLEDSLPGLTVSSDNIDAFVASIALTPEVQQEAGAIARSQVTAPTEGSAATVLAAAPASPRTLLSREIVASMQASYASGSGAGIMPSGFDLGGAVRAAWTLARAAAQILSNIANRFKAGRDHGLVCTIVEETLRALYGANAGSAIWEEMKKETEDAFIGDGSSYGGTAVIEEICKLVKEDPQVLITLVGHSTGGVYIGNFLRNVDVAMRHQGNSDYQFDVILMAPANTIDFWAANYGKRVKGIRVFGMTDTAECKDLLMSSDTGDSPDASILGRVYPRSLLYLVSGICESFEAQNAASPSKMDAYDMPLLGMERFFSNQQVFNSNYASILDARRALPTTNEALRDLKSVRVLSPTPSQAGRGLRSGALKHGDFPGDSQTQDSLEFCFVNGLVPSEVAARGSVPTLA
jgi:hypothetical protein